MFKKHKHFIYSLIFDYLFFVFVFWFVFVCKFGMSYAGVPITRINTIFWSKDLHDLVRTCVSVYGRRLFKWKLERQKAMSCEWNGLCVNILFRLLTFFLSKHKMTHYYCLPNANVLLNVLTHLSFVPKFFVNRYCVQISTLWNHLW